MRRNTKTMYEWRKVYRDKEELMLERGFPEVSPHEFYRDLFPEGSLQSAEHDGKGNVIATQIRPSGKGRTKQWVIDDSLNMLDKVIGDEFGLIPPITFYGKTHTKQNAHELYAYRSVARCSGGIPRPEAGFPGRAGRCGYTPGPPDTSRTAAKRCPAARWKRPEQK